MNRAETGKKGEDLATSFLEEQGYAIIERNFKTPFGEIDIIAKRKKVIAMVEVKTAKVKRFAQNEFAPELRVNERKHQKLIKLGKFYLIIRKLTDVPWEIDVVGIEINPYGLSEIRHWKQVVIED